MKKRTFNEWIESNEKRIVKEAIKGAFLIISNMIIEKFRIEFMNKYLSYSDNKIKLLK
jgi:hypothetical protein